MSQKWLEKFCRVLKYVYIHIYVSTFHCHHYKSTNLQNALYLNVYSFMKCTVNPLHYKCTFALSSPSEFLAEIIITNTLQYIMICDPLLKLLVIPLHHIIEYIIIDFARVYIWYMQEGISLPVKD